jgi:RNA polymerase sigma factor (sigma-70 family)
VGTGDVRLAARFADGEPEAIREVYQAYGRLVYAVAYKVLGDSSLAEDATQQTFLQAWRAAATYDPTRELGPWLATISRRAAISLYRRDRRHEDIDNVDPSDPRLTSLPPSVEQLYDVWEVRRALDSLPSQERELIQLQHYRELSHSEIAEHLAIPIGTVKSRTYRAHRRLAGLLGHLREPDADAPASSDTTPVAQLPRRSGRVRRDG